MKISRNKRRIVFNSILGLAVVWAVGLFITSIPTPDAHAASPWVSDGWDSLQAGGISTCAQFGDDAYCWGYLGGRGLQRYVSNPALIDRTGDLGSAAVETIQPGYFHTCSVAEGKIYCYGRNTSGETGIGTISTDVDLPTAVDTSGALSNTVATDVSVSAGFSCGVASGKAYCWGSNSSGQLGDGTLNASSVPVAVDTNGVLNGKTVTAISTFAAGACALANGNVYCWGNGSNGVLGNGVAGLSTVPVAVDTNGVLNGKTVTSISTGEYNACAIANGEVFCWGSNADGQLGDAANSTQSLVPVAVDTTTGLSGKIASKLSSDGDSTCVLASSIPYCWGKNTNGQLGNGTKNTSNVPVAVDTSGPLSGLSITNISIGNDHACVLANRNAYCWGSNHFNQLGDGTSTDSLVPVKVIARPLYFYLQTDNAPADSGKFTTIISGNDFQAGATVRYGTELATINSIESNEIQLTIPVSPVTGPVDVTVTNPDGTSGILVDGFTFNEPQPLSVSSISVTEAPLSGLDLVTVNGHGFEPGMTFTIGGKIAPLRSVPSEDYATIDIPAVDFDQTSHSLVATKPDGSSASLVVDLVHYSLKVLPNKFLQQIGSADEASDQYIPRPSGVAVDKDGNMYVTETANNVVKVFSKNGTLLRQFGGSGSNDGEFDYPTAIKIGDDDNIYVLDNGNKRTQVFTLAGEYIRQFGPSVDAEKRLYGADTMAFDKAGNVYIGECDHDTTTNSVIASIKVFSRGGTYMRTIGSVGSGNGEFGCITALNVDNNGLIYTYDVSSARLQVLSADGSYLRQLSSQGIANGKIGNIEDIAFDVYGNILLADSSNRIQVYDKSEKYLGQIGTEGDGAGQLYNPYAIAVGVDNTIVVADYSNGRIQLFEGMAPKPEPTVGVIPIKTPNNTSGAVNVKAPDVDYSGETEESKEQEQTETASNENPLYVAQEKAQQRAAHVSNRNSTALSLSASLIQAAVTLVSEHPAAVATAAATTVVSVSAVGYIFFFKP